MKIKLKPWHKEDASSLARTLSNQKILNNLRDGLPYPYTKDDALHYIDAILQADTNNVFAFAITVNDKIIGNISITRGNNIHFRTGELVYYIDEHYWGQGIMSNAIGQICNYVFLHSDIIRIYAEPFSYNIASCKALEKNGFICEGVLRKNAIKNGKVIDMKMYSLIKDDKEIE